MALIRPLKGIRPRPELAAEVVAPPYDVLSEAEARAIHAEHPRTFLTVTRSEVNLPRGIDSHSAQAYAAARIALDTLLAEGALVQEDAECFYLYAQKMGEHEQTALMALCDTREYQDGSIRKHEFTRPDKEQDRVDHISACDAQTGLVFLAHRAHAEVQLAINLATAEELFAITTADGVQHSLSRIAGANCIDRIVKAFGALESLYIADGHHRSAAASRVASAREEAGSSRWFLAGIFPDDQLYCMAYNRLVHDLAGFTPSSLLRAMDERFEIEPTESPLPEQRGTFTMYLDGRWHLVTPRPGVVPQDDPVGRLDVAVLQDNVLGPLLGIDDPRRDTRIDFVGGIRGPEFLQAAVDQGRARVAFHMYPTGMDQLFAVADADRVMPPKSTWFEPKLAGGMLVHRLR